MARLVCIGFVISAQAEAAGVFNVKDLGATGDGKTKDTQAIQKAVDAASQAGGGTVLLPIGTYLSGTIRLKSNVTLHFDRGATLLGSTDIEETIPTSGRSSNRSPTTMSARA